MKKVAFLYEAALSNKLFPRRSGANAFGLRREKFLEALHSRCGKFWRKNIGHRPLPFALDVVSVAAMSPTPCHIWQAVTSIAAAGGSSCGGPIAGEPQSTWREHGILNVGCTTQAEQPTSCAAGSPVVKI